MCIYNIHYVIFLGRILLVSFFIFKPGKYSLTPILEELCYSSSAYTYMRIFLVSENEGCISGSLNLTMFVVSQQLD